MVAFPNLTFAGGVNVSGNNPSFTFDVSTAFPLLTEVGYPAVPTYTPGEEVVVFTGDVVLTSDADIAAFSAGNYDAIHGSLEISDSLSGNITSLAGLGKLNYVTGDCDIHDNSVITNCLGLDALVRVDGNFRVRNNSALQNVGTTSAGISYLIYVGADVEISGNPNINIYDSFECVTTIVGALLFHNNANSASGFNRLTTVDKIWVYDNVGGMLNAFARVLALPNTSGVGAAFRYENNTDGMTDSFQRLVSVGTGGILIQNNTTMNSMFNCFQSLTSITGNNDLLIKGNTALNYMGSMFNALVVCGGTGSTLAIENSPNLRGTDMASSFFILENGRNLRLVNVRLESFGAIDSFSNREQPFAAMKSLRTLFIDSCPLLTNINGLKTLVGSQVTPGPVTITNNSTLPTTAQVASLGTYLTGTGYAGTFTNTGNGPG